MEVFSKDSFLGKYSWMKSNKFCLGKPFQVYKAKKERTLNMNWIDNKWRSLILGIIMGNTGTARRLAFWCFLQIIISIDLGINRVILIF